MKKIAVEPLDGRLEKTRLKLKFKGLPVNG